MPLAGSALLLLGTLFVDALPAAAPLPAAVGPVDVVVTATSPVDAERLADALRVYLDGYGVRVGSAAASDPGDLRRQLADARRLGEEVRAMAVVRVQRGEGAGVAGARGMIEIDVVDLATEKVLIAEIPATARDEDLYRALALKIRASLRATLSEAPERLRPGTGLARLAEEGAGGGAEGGVVVASDGDGAVARAGAAAAAPGALSLETGYSLVAFPLTGVGIQGLSISGAWSLRAWLDVTLGTAVLGAARGEAAGVSAVGTVVPVLASARLRARSGRLDGMLGPAVALTYVSVAPSSAVTAVRATQYVVPALGADLEGRLRMGASAWFYARATALGVVLGERYLAQGHPVLDTSGLQASVSAGLGLMIF